MSLGLLVLWALLTVNLIGGVWVTVYAAVAALRGQAGARHLRAMQAASATSAAPVGTPAAPVAASVRPASGLPAAGPLRGRRHLHLIQSHP